MLKRNKKAVTKKVKHINKQKKEDKQTTVVIFHFLKTKEPIVGWIHNQKHNQ